MSLNLLIVESPKKAKTIQKFLPKNWIVKASYGHIRELAKSGTDKLGFSIDKVDKKVVCEYVSDQKQKQNLQELRRLASTAPLVVLATDPDREGEAIAFHLIDALKLKKYQRITYREITPEAIKEALAKGRQLDNNLAGSAIARACLDKLVGYKVSPILWQLNIGASSAGRVQAPTLNLLSIRERQIQNFKPEPYWSVWVDYQQGWRAYFNGEEKNNAEVSPNDSDSRDDSEVSQTQEVESVRVKSEAEAIRLVEIAQKNPHQVVELETKTQHKKPPPPFTTSSLQQAAGARLKLNPEKTMQIAQHLFEAGLITYHRSDSTTLSDRFIEEARKYLQEKDPKNLPPSPNQFKNKKNAQEAHEAIRPTDLTKPSTVLKEELDSDHFALYELIWRRAIASQCNPARIEKTKIISQSGSAFWLARGKVIKFFGYARYWKDLGQDNNLPPVQEGETLQLLQANSDRKMTQPPPRYSEAKLVQIMERQGIGRPSTYSSTIKTLKERNYATIDKGKLVVSELGLKVDDFLVNCFTSLSKSNFTAEMESQLDAIASGKLDWQKYLADWYFDCFIALLEQAQKKVLMETPGDIKVSLNNRTREKSKQKCSQCGQYMDKIPSKSKKLSRPYFLKCSQCEVVMFYDKQQKAWLEPNAKSIPTITEYLCPVCGSFLAMKTYSKDGQTKQMLVCSTQKGRHEDVAFFQSKSKWWSPKLGELKV